MAGPSNLEREVQSESAGGARAARTAAAIKSELAQSALTLKSALTLSGPSGAFLLLLLSADMMFLALHLIHILSDFAQDPGYDITLDRGFAESYQLVKLYWIVLCLAWLLVRERELVYGAWGVLFSYLLLDDWFMIHEHVGSVLVQKLQIPARLSLRGQDFGEVMVSAMVGLLLLAIIGIGFRFGSPRARAACGHLLVLLGLLAVAGILFDLLHIMFPSVLFTLLEDGGEMVVASLTCWYVFSLAGQRRPAESTPERTVGTVRRPTER